MGWRAPVQAALALVLALSACGAAGGPPSSGGPSPTPAQVLTEADSGRTVALAVGQSAALHLSNRYTWTEPQATGGAVRVTRGDAGAAVYQEWTIAAVARGTATVTSGGRVACSPGAVCPGAILAFTVTVTVA